MSGDEHESEREPGDWLIDNHPDLIDPSWHRKVKHARKAVARDARKAREARLLALLRLGRRRHATGLRPGRRRKLGNRTWTAVLALAMVVVLFLIAVNQQHRPGMSVSPVAGGAVPLDTVPPSSTATTRVAAALDLNQPFANTPAASWSDGAVGIVPPPAAAVGSWSARQVAAAENAVRQALIAAHLDNRILIQHDLSAFLATLAPNVRAEERTTLTNPTTRNAGVTLLATGFSLLPAPIKVNGTMAASVGKDGALIVHTNYVFAYPFAPQDPSTIQYSWQLVAIDHAVADFEVVGVGAAAADRGVWPGPNGGYSAQMACTPFQQGYLAPLYSEPENSLAPATEDPDALFDPNHPIDIPPGCPPVQHI